MAKALIAVLVAGVACGCGVATGNLQRCYGVKLPLLTVGLCVTQDQADVEVMCIQQNALMLLDKLKKMPIDAGDSK